MIGFLEGKIIKKESDRILLLVGQIGYEVLIPKIIMETLAKKSKDELVSLYIYYHQTEHQPKPILIGFQTDIEREFFHQFISVDAIGPIKAVQAFGLPVREIARAIETNDVKMLTRLKGIGQRTAEKITATLKGKMGKYALIRDEGVIAKENQPRNQLDLFDQVAEQVVDVLVSQLGHKLVEAKLMVSKALQRNNNISTAEELFEEVYRGQAD